MKIIFFFIIIFSLLACKQNNNTYNSITLEFEKIKYDSVSMLFRLEHDSIHRSEGISQDGYTWKFNYPDSIYDYIDNISIHIRTEFDTVVRRIVFSYVEENDTMSVGNFNFNSPISSIKTRYHKSDTIFNTPLFDIKKQEIVYKTYIMDNYFINTYTDKELLSSIEGLSKGYSMFSNTYDENLNDYIALTKKYPNSHYLLTTLAGTLTYYNSKTDIVKVYNCFTEEQKQSHFGKKINEYLSNTVFENSKLPTWDSGDIEDIVKDPTCYNLIIFSASWCAPCHRMLPLVKEIHNDLGDKLQIVYISTDEPNTKDNWKAWMEKGNIACRSLMATDNLKEIKERYTVQTIPHQILVYPESTEMEVIDVRKDADKNKLYELVNTQL